MIYMTATRVGNDGFCLTSRAGDVVDFTVERRAEVPGGSWVTIGPDRYVATYPPTASTVEIREILLRALVAGPVLPWWRRVWRRITRQPLRVSFVTIEGAP